MMEIRCDAVAREPGQPRATITKHAGDSRAYIVDCYPLLRPYELAVGAECIPQEGIEIQGVRTRQGRYIEVRASGGGGARASQDWPVNVRVQTTGGLITVQIAFRVFA